MMISKQDVMKAPGSLQVCAGQEADAEAAIHAVHDIFKDHTTEAVLLTDAENAFNAINRKAILHNISIACPIISTYISNCCNTPACLFIIEGIEILSKEETTQRDPTVMTAYALGVTPLIQHLLGITSSSKLYSKEIAYADDFIVAGSIKDIKCYWEHLNPLATFFGYYSKASKSHLIVKSQYLETANVVFGNTIPDISELPIPLEHTIRQKFIPAITGGQICSYHYYKHVTED